MIEHTTQKDFLSFPNFTHRPKFREDNTVSAFWAGGFAEREPAQRCEFYRAEPIGY